MLAGRDCIFKVEGRTQSQQGEGVHRFCGGEGDRVGEREGGREGKQKVAFQVESAC